MPDDTPICFTVAEFCAAARISKTFLYDLWARGNGPPRVKLAGRVLIPKAKAISWLERKAGEAA